MGTLSPIVEEDEEDLAEEEMDLEVVEEEGFDKDLSLAAVEEILDYKFRDRDILEKALSLETFYSLVKRHKRLCTEYTSTRKLARVAVESGLRRFLPSHLKPQIQEFMRDMGKVPTQGSVLTNPPKVLVDLVESLCGAVFVDSQSDETLWQVFKHLSGPIIQT